MSDFEMAIRILNMEARLAECERQLLEHRQFGDAHLHRHEDLVHEDDLRGHLDALRTELAPAPAPTPTPPPAPEPPPPTPEPKPTLRAPEPEREPRRQHPLHHKVGGSA